MSDPVSNREIEDVLSSIRRLVSVEKRSEGQEPSRAIARPVDTEAGQSDIAPRAPLATQGAPRSDDEKLVLSPSFRVTERAEEPEDHDDLASEDVDYAHAGDDSLSLEQWQISPEQADHLDEAAFSEAEDSLTEAEAEAESQPALEEHQEDISEQVSEETDDHPEMTEAVTSPDDEPDAVEDDTTAEDFSDHEPDEDVAEHHTDETEVEPEVAPTFEEADQEAASPEAEIAALTGADRELEARIAEVEAAVAATQDDWDSDGDDADDYYAARAEPLPWEDYTRETDDAEDTFDTASDWAEERDMTPVAETVESAETPLTAATSEAEMLAAMRKSRTDALAQHDTPVSKDDDTPETLDFASRRGGALPDEAAKNAHDAPRDDEKTDRNDDWYSEDAVMDEDALRDLVADIVRQELQGTLGERITRNVRKLVRREIHRAMLGQDFD